MIAGAAFVAALMNHHGWIVYFGAAILGEVAGKMILEDDFVELTVGAASAQIEWLIRIALSAGIVITGLYFAPRSSDNGIVPRRQESLCLSTLKDSRHHCDRSNPDPAGAVILALTFRQVGLGVRPER